MKSNRGNKSPVRMGTRIWYLIKLSELVLVSACILILCLNQFLFVIHDDFSIVHNKPQNMSDKHRNKSETLLPAEKIEMLHATNSTEGFTDLKTIPAAAATDDDDFNCTIKSSKSLTFHVHPKGETNLSDFLSMYPCVSTILVVFVMEMVGYLFQDPLNKCSNILYLMLAQVLSICLFTKSVHITVTNSYFTMICISVFSGLLLVVITINIILVCFGK